MVNVKTLDDLPFAKHLVEHSGELEPHQDYETVHFIAHEFEAPSAPNARFFECAFTSIGFSKGQFKRARFNDVWFNSVRLVDMDLAESSWLDSAVQSSMLAGITAFSTRMQRVVFRECKFNAVNFRASDFTDVTFEKCLLREVDFNNAKLTKVKFPGTTFSRVSMDKVTLSKVDFRGAAELDLATGYDSLRGATIGTGQLMQLAPALAHCLGITVKD